MIGSENEQCFEGAQSSVNSGSIRRKLSVPEIKAAAELAAETTSLAGGAEEVFVEERSI